MTNKLSWRVPFIAFMTIASLVLALYPIQDASLTLAGKLILAVFVLAVGLWVGTPSELLTPASLVVLFLVILSLGVDSTTAAKSLTTGMSGYADANLWLLILGFFYAAAFAKSGLSKRTALFLMNLTHGSTFWILFMVGIVNIVIMPTTPSTIAKGGLLLPIIVGIVSTAGVEVGKSNFGKAVGIYAGSSDNIMSAGMLTATIANPLALSILKKGADIDISWGQWFIYTFPMALISTFLAFIIIYFMFRPEVKVVKGGAEYVERELKSLGPVNWMEKLTLVSFLIAFILWVINPSFLGDSIYKGLPPVLKAIVSLNVFVKGLLAALILFIPKYGVISWKDAEKEIPWGIYVMFGAALGLSAALNLTKSMDWAVMKIISSMGLETLPFIVVFIVVVLFMFYGHALFFTYTAMGAAMLPIIISLAKAMNYPVLSLYVPAMTLVPYSLLFTFSTVPLLMFSSAGMFEAKDSARFGAIFGFVILAQWLLIGLPYWKMLGIIP